jgi:hypothetical protein
MRVERAEPKVAGVIRTKENATCLNLANGRSPEMNMMCMVSASYVAGPNHRQLTPVAA